MHPDQIFLGFFLGTNCFSPGFVFKKAASGPGNGTRRWKAQRLEDLPGIVSKKWQSGLAHHSSVKLFDQPLATGPCIDGLSSETSRNEDETET